MGTIAVDAKAKAFVNGHFVLDLSERRRLDGFETVFGIPVWYACFPPTEPMLCYLFRNRALMGSAVTHDPQRHLIRVPLTLAAIVEHINTPFMQAPVHMVTGSFCGSQAACAGPSGKRKSALGM